MMFHKVKNIFTQEKRNQMIQMANEAGAFMDNSYGISFYKHPLQLDDLEIDGLWQVQMLKQTVEESGIHKDRNRTNEFDNIYMPRTTVVSWPIQGEGITQFYDDNKNLVATVNYDKYLQDGAILNTGGYFHNVKVTKGPRIVFQLCFDVPFDSVVEYYEKDLKNAWI